MPFAPSPFMARALEIAANGLGLVEPNPMVGAVLVKDGQIIGEGFHSGFGKPHAEIEALTDCKNKSQNPAGATLYVTLEPCSHFGKTPPCAKAVIEAGIKKVVAAMEDPFEKVAGRGFKMLKNSDIEVEIGDGEKQARKLNEPFIKRVQTGLPWIILKWAQTIDGKIATASGDSKWISSEQSRKIVHQLRGRMDGIMVGPGTARSDDPKLTARLENMEAEKGSEVFSQNGTHDSQKKLPAPFLLRTARRIILDPDLSIAPGLSLIKDSAAPVTVAVSEDTFKAKCNVIDSLEQRGIEIIGLPKKTISAPPDFKNSHLDLSILMRHLSEKHSATNVLVEGGSKLFGSLIAQNLADQALVFIAPKIVGDSAGISAIDGLKTERITDAHKLSLEEITTIGNGDLLLDYRLRGLSGE